MSQLNCHLCERETDSNCRTCGEPVCFDCCVKMTIHNQIDYALCSLCGDVAESVKADHYQRIEEEKETEQKEKELKAKTRRENYWKPENIEKRMLAKTERKRKHAEQVGKMFRNAVRIVNNWLS